MRVKESTFATNLPLTHRLQFDFLERFRLTLDRKEQIMMFQVVYFGFNAKKFNRWLIETEYASPQRANKNKEFELVHDKFIDFLEAEGLN